MTQLQTRENARPRSSPSCRSARIDECGGKLLETRPEFKETALRDRLIEDIRESNRQGRNAWSRVADHRARVTELLARAAPPSDPSLAVLGAGNLNDLDLPRLLSAYADIHLADIDRETVRSSLARLDLSDANRIHLHAPVDLTGALRLLGRPAPDANVVVDGLARHRVAIPGAPFAVAASTGLLTQLLQSVHDSLLPRSAVGRVLLRLRDKHLLDLVQLTRRGGTLVLVSDLVSTTTAPALETAVADELEQRMAELVAARNFFTGTNPYRIVALLEEDTRFSRLVTDVRLLDPWLWPVTIDRRHLTYAIVARRR